MSHVTISDSAQFNTSLPIWSNIRNSKVTSVEFSTNSQTVCEDATHFKVFFNDIYLEVIFYKKQIQLAVRKSFQQLTN
jgi:hypothetical protein